MQLRRSLVFFAPDWYPWKVDNNSVLSCYQERIERGFSEVYQLCAMSLTAMMRDFARVCMSPPVEIKVVS